MYLKTYFYRYASDMVFELDRATSEGYESLLTRKIFCKNAYFVEACIDQNYTGFELNDVFMKNL